YATTSEVWAQADYFLERTSPSGRTSLEPYRLVARANARRGVPDVERSIGVEVVGMTACPCAMETVRDDFLQAHPEIAKWPDGVRDVLDRLLKRYPKMPDTTWVRVKSEAEESIHKHNAFAERSTTFGELRAL